MPRSPDSTTDTYLDVCRTLGVPDAALRRHHGAGPETPLRVAIDGDRGSPTADLLAALAATGRVLDLRDGLAPGDGDRLTAALARFGLFVECRSAEAEMGAPGDEADGDDRSESAGRLVLEITDAVTGTTHRIPTGADGDEALAALDGALPDPETIAFVELLDGRHLVAEPRELAALAERYGSRIQPFDDPLVVPEAAIDGTANAPGEDDAPTPTRDAVLAQPAGAAGVADDPATRPTSAAAPTAAEPDDAEGSFGEFLAAVDDEPADSIEAALDGEDSNTHTIEGDGDDVAAAASTTIGGGPRRTVSTAGIDEVFDQLESDSADAEQSPAATQLMSESSDPPTDEPRSTDDADASERGLAGGPTRTVSTTSADDILARATGDSDFEEIAAAEDGADPDAVLADAEDVPPTLADGDVAGQLSAGEDSADAFDEDAAAAAESTPDAEEPVGTADVPPADPAATTDDAADGRIESPGERSDVTAPPAADAGPATGEAVERGPDEDSETDAATPMSPAAGDAEPDVAEAASATSVDGSAIASEPDDEPSGPDDREHASPSDGVHDHARTASDDRSSGADGTDSGTIDEDLTGDDVELRRGSQSVDQPDAPAAGPDDADVDSDEPAAADGPLAASGGVARPDSTAETHQSDEVGGTQSDTVERSDDEEPTEADGDVGLVGRITSTIFGR